MRRSIMNKSDNHIHEKNQDIVTELAELKRDYEAIKQENLELIDAVTNLEYEVHELDQNVVRLEFELTEEEALSRRNEMTGSVYESIYNHNEIATILTDHHLVINHLNPAACKLLGADKSHLISQNIRRLLTKESSAELLKLAQNYIRSSKASVSPSKVLKLKNGLLIQHFITPIKDKQALSFLISLLPISFSTMNQQSFYIANSLIEQLREGIMVTDEKNLIIKVNQAFQEITGYSVQEVLGKTPVILQSGRHGPQFYLDMWDKIQNHGWWAGEIWNKRKSGEIYPEWIQITRIRDDITGQNFYVATFSDITDRKQHQNQLDRLAFYDALTGLPNRRHLKQTLDVQLAQFDTAKRHLLAVLFIDLDNFKPVNDNFGHAEGDLVLKEATQRLVSGVRENDLVARLGGDEFVILLTPVKGTDNALKVVKNLIQLLAKPYRTLKSVHRLSASVGVAFYPKDGLNSEDLMRRADSAMYDAKKNGRNQYAVFEAENENQLVQTNKLIQLVWKAVEQPQTYICMHYQPIFDANKHFIKLEALVRLVDQDGNIIYPNDFISHVENGGIMPKFGLAIFSKICSDVKQYDLPVQVKVAVNLSALQFQKDDLISDLSNIAREFELTLDRFNFEVTETATMQNLDLMTNILKELREQRCEILLDDFGTGYASLSMLKNLPVDVLKIDMSFIKEIEFSAETRDLVTGMIAMAKALRLKIITEGVETKWQFNWLIQQGVDLIQGYLLSKPIELKSWPQIEQSILDKKL